MGLRPVLEQRLRVVRTQQRRGEEGQTVLLVGHERTACWGQRQVDRNPTQPGGADTTGIVEAVRPTSVLTKLIARTNEAPLRVLDGEPKVIAYFDLR